MQFKSLFLTSGFLLLTLISSCTKICQDPFVISGNVAERIGKQVVWNRTIDPYVQEWICEKLTEPLTCDSLVQIALLNNPKIQALYENIGIASADLLQASLFHNPLFDGYVRFPNRRSLSLNTELSIAFQFLDFFLVPLRKRVAQRELEKVEFEVTHEVLGISFEIEKIYFQLLAAIEREEKLKAILELFEAEIEISEDQLQAKTIYTLQYQEKSNRLSKAQLELQQIEMLIASYYSQLTALLGLCNTCLVVAPIQLEIPLMPCLDELQCMALERRFDFLAAKWKLAKIAQQGKTKKWWAYTNLMLGISSEREAEGFWETGPSFSGAIPLFDYGQADRARLQAEFFQSLDNLKALKIAIFSEITEHYTHLNILSEMLSSYRELLNMQQKIVDDTQLLYNVMTYSVYNLLQNKIDFYRLEMDYLLALKDYRVAFVKLKEAIGGA